MLINLIILSYSFSKKNICLLIMCLKWQVRSKINLQKSILFYFIILLWVYFVIKFHNFITFDILNIVICKRTYKTVSKKQSFSVIMIVNDTLQFYFCLNYIYLERLLLFICNHLSSSSIVFWLAYVNKEYCGYVNMHHVTLLSISSL